MTASHRLLSLRAYSIASIVIILNGCYPASSKHVAGKYEAHAEWGNSILELRTDGKFIEEATLKDGSRRRAEGRWEYRFENHFSTVSRGPCLRLDHSGIDEQNWDYCNEAVEQYVTGGIEINVDPDFGFSYVKLSQ
jgi:hypothetical protein